MDAIQPIWNDKQLGLVDGTTPKTLRNGERAYVDVAAVEKARSVFNNLLGHITGPIQATRAILSVVDDPAVRPRVKTKAGKSVLLERNFSGANRTVSVSA